MTGRARTVAFWAGVGLLVAMGLGVGGVIAWEVMSGTYVR